MENPYFPQKVKIKKIIKETIDTRTYTVDFKTAHEPGQFVEVSLLNAGEVPISISSYSTKHLELCIRDVGTVTHALAQLKKGDYVYVRGPYGKGYPMQYMKDNTIMVIAGGTGVAAVRSVIHYIEQHRADFKDVELFLGFRTPNDMLFKNDIKRWEKKFNLHLTVDKADQPWTYNTGVVTKLLETANLSNEHKIVVACGPPIMIKFTLLTLEKLGFHKDQIYVSLERLMKCGLGKCGHCMIQHMYVCKDGPVFRYDKVYTLKE